jgi:hypothetical protein
VTEENEVTEMKEEKEVKKPKCRESSTTLTSQTRCLSPSPLAEEGRGEGAHFLDRFTATRHSSLVTKFT